MCLSCPSAAAHWHSCPHLLATATVTSAAVSLRCRLAFDLDKYFLLFFFVYLTSTHGRTTVATASPFPCPLLPRSQPYQQDGHDVGNDEDDNGCADHGCNNHHDSMAHHAMVATTPSYDKVATGDSNVGVAMWQRRRKVFLVYYMYIIFCLYTS